MNRRLTKYGVWAACSMGLATAADAGSTKTFEFKDPNGMSAADLEGVAVTSHGTIVPSIRFKRTDIREAAVAYASLQSKDGALWVGTGHEGKILKIIKGKVARTWETKQVLVTSLVQLPNGDVLAATLPEARIFRITPSGGISEWLKLPSTSHIWALVYEPTRKVIFAGTGPQGRLIEIKENKTLRTLYDGDVQHVLSLAWAADKKMLYAGTSDGALLLAVEPNAAKSQVLQDFAVSEVTSLSYRNGVLGIVANDFGAGGRASASLKADIKGSGPAEVAAPSKSTSGKGRFWLMDAQGRFEQIYQTDETYFPTVFASIAGGYFLGTAKDGKLYRVTKDRQWSMWANTDDRQVLTILENGRDLTITTGDVAAIYQTDSSATQAEWIAKPLDAKFIARWGRLDWRARSAWPLSFQTRSGATEKPDAQWSAWSKPMTVPSVISSPAARYLQIKASFKRGTQTFGVMDGIRSMVAYYLPQNQRANVTEVNVKFSLKEKVKISWKTDNADGDSLRYKLSFRGDTQDVWRDIYTGHERLTASEYTWDASGLPDGYYLIKVEAFDDLQNANPLSSYGESAPFVIDNHAPDIMGLTWDGRCLKGYVRDRVGPIAKIEYALNSGEWKVAAAEDGILDGLEERFCIPIQTGSLSPRTIFAVRATDSVGHVGSAELFGGRASVIKQ